MMQQVIMVCRACGSFWESGAPAACTEPDHHHDQVEIHRHRDLVRLPDGTELIAVSFDPADPYQRESVPDFGLYLDQHWQPPWAHDHFDWPDFGVPEDRVAVHAALHDVLDRARSGQLVEIGCLGGHGRTGTALACLAALTGQPVDDAVAFVRNRYCAKAVETAEQEVFVEQLIGGETP